VEAAKWKKKNRERRVDRNMKNVEMVALISGLGGEKRDRLTR
jgi:hypothetical protein